MIISNATPLISFARIGELASKSRGSLGLPVTGSVGVLIRAKQLGEIPAVKPLLEEMLRKGIYFSQKFVGAVLEKMHE